MVCNLFMTPAGLSKEQLLFLFVVVVIPETVSARIPVQVATDAQLHCFPPKQYSEHHKAVKTGMTISIEHMPFGLCFRLIRVHEKTENRSHVYMQEEKSSTVGEMELLLRVWEFLTSHCGFEQI